MTAAVKQRILDRILADITDRRGWRQEWDGFDADIRNEIREAFTRILDEEMPTSARTPLPDERESVTIRIEVGDTHGYLTIGMYPDGEPGEVFVKGFGTYGSTVTGLLDALCISISLGLQSGVPLCWYVDMLSFLQFPPSSSISQRAPDGLGPYRSIVDAIARTLGAKYCSDPADLQKIDEG